MTKKSNDSPALAPQQFTKKPVTILAIRWEGNNTKDVLDFVGTEKAWYQTDGDLEAICIETLEGRMRARIWDWIIKGTENEFYPCKPDIFEKYYSPALAEPAATSQPKPEKRDMKEYLADPGCSMAAHPMTDHGKDGYCAVRGEPCPVACAVKRMRHLQDDLEQSRENFHIQDEAYRKLKELGEAAAPSKGMDAPEKLCPECHCGQAKRGYVQERDDCRTWGQCNNIFHEGKR